MSSRSGDNHFLIIGAQRCGTTYLYELLDEHPEIEMARPVRPEPKFFLDDAAVDKGIAFYEQELFGRTPGARMFGEKGTSYIEHEAAARRIAGMLPAARLILVLRDPVARAVSNHRFSVDNGVEDLPVAAALTLEAEQRPYDRDRISVSPYRYLQRGVYLPAIEAYLRWFPREQLHIALFEELVAEPGPARAILSFLGVDPGGHAGVLDRIVNPADEPAGDLDPTSLASLRAFFRPWNEQLASFLGRALPWS